MTRYLVTSALPYTNNRPHLGHIAGAYLPADIYVRYLRMEDHDVVFICGSDDHGVPIMMSARREGVTPADIVTKYRDSQERAFRGIGIEFDFYSGTSTCPHHVELSHEFFKRIYDQGHLVPKESEQFYCGNCDQFLPDRFVEGTCPHCGFTGARGDQCDSCTRSFEQVDLKDPYCATCKETPTIRTTTQWFFRLDEYRERLSEWLESKEGWRENVRNYSLGILKEPLPERSITRDLNWGVPVPLDEAKDKVLYVWFDAPVGYVSFTKELFESRGDPEGWRPYWQDPDTQLVHFIGKDNIIFHAIIWPAMLMGHGDMILPANVPSNEYLQVGGEKISKSRGEAIWVEDALEDYPASVLRYYLTSIAPESKDSSFTYEDFVQRSNEVLSGVIGNLVHRLFTFCGRYFDGRVPALPAEDATAAGVFEAIAKARDSWRSALERVRLKEALSVAVDLAREGNRAFDAAEPWATRKTDLERCGADIRIGLELVHALSVLLAPFLPETSETLLASFGGPTQSTRATLDALGTPMLDENAEVNAPGVLFPKLELEEQQ